MIGQLFVLVSVLKNILLHANCLPIQLNYPSSIYLVFAINYQNRMNFKIDDRAPSLGEIFYESFTDPVFVTMFISSLIVFQLFQKLGHILWHNLVSEEQKERTSKWLFGSYVQATLHSIIFIPAYYVIITYDTHDYIYKYFTVLLPIVMNAVDLVSVW